MVDMVKKVSAQLFLQNEVRIPVNRDHADMTKFKTKEDPDYFTVLKYIRECLQDPSIQDAGMELRGSRVTQVANQCT
jgi:hypothetical protein